MPDKINLSIRSRLHEGQVNIEYIDKSPPLKTTDILPKLHTIIELLLLLCLFFVLTLL